MRLTLFSLLSLIGAAVASHDVCFYYAPGDPAGDLGIVTVRVKTGFLMSEVKRFSPFTWVYEFVNSRGVIDVETKNFGTFSAKFDGHEWGKFTFQGIESLGTGEEIRFGCYDTSNDKYCADYEHKMRWCFSHMLSLRSKYQ